MTLRERLRIRSRILASLGGEPYDADQFSLHERLVIAQFGRPSEGFAQSVLPQQINSSVLSQLDKLPPINLKARLAETESPHLVLSSLSDSTKQSIISSYRAWEIPHNSHASRSLQLWIADKFSSLFVSPISIINVRAWAVGAETEFGPFLRHLDGFKPGHFKIMIYPLGLSVETGGIEIDGESISTAPCGASVAFDNSRLIHRAIPPRSGYSRVAVEVTVQRTLCSQLQRYPSHFNGRHLKHSGLFYEGSSLFHQES
jgi:hypothetical protein